MSRKRKDIFFLGKGGVGKSTVSALTAVRLALQGKNVLLVSLDPAHNQSDIFQMEFSGNPREINRNLSVQEIDIDKQIKNYLSAVESQVKRSYSYLTALNLENYFGIIKYSPGIEEYALLAAYSEITGNNGDKDFIIFDMPPTALALKFFGLPKLSLLWLNKLLELRNEILRKREIITKIKFGKREVERDKLINKLSEQVAKYNGVKSAFENNGLTKINLVLNPDELSFSESELIKKKLEEFGITVSGIIVNKYVRGYGLSRIKEKFNSTDLKILPASESPLLGFPALENYLHSNWDNDTSFE